MKQPSRRSEAFALLVAMALWPLLQVAWFLLNRTPLQLTLGAVFACLFAMAALMPGAW
jgi:hypothetical protein